MGRHQPHANRFRENAKLSELREGVQAVHDEGGGLLEVEVITAEYFLDIALASMLGDEKATALARSVMGVVNRIGSLKGDESVLCATCTSELFGEAFSVVLVRPASQNAKKALGFGLCATCCSTAPLKESAERVVQKFWPGAKPVVITNPEGGRA